MLYYGMILTVILVNTQKWGAKMADYQRMYSILCGAVDRVIDPLEAIAGASPWVAVLRKALLDAEEVYIESLETEGRDAPGSAISTE